MADYNKLEQLNRLREKGALSTEEFEQEKAKLLGSSRGDLSQRTRMILVAVALILIVGAAILFGKGAFGPGMDSPEHVVTTNTSTPFLNEIEAVNVKGAPEAPVAQIVGSTPSATLDWAFSYDVIGLNPSFVEGKLGPAKSKSKSEWAFEVRGCNVSYGVKGSEITSVSTFVKAGCLPKVGSRTITPQTTFAQLRGSNDIIRSSCIYNCGNAYDPTIDLYQHGYHANNFIEVVYQSNFGDAQDNARELWHKSIRVMHGIGAEDYERENYEWFQCLAGPPASVLAAIGPEHVGYVTMGRDLTRDGSCRYPS